MRDDRRLCRSRLRQAGRTPAAEHDDRRIATDADDGVGRNGWLRGVQPAIDGERPAEQEPDDQDHREAASGQQEQRVRGATSARGEEEAEKMSRTNKSAVKRSMCAAEWKCSG